MVLVNIESCFSAPRIERLTDRSIERHKLVKDRLATNIQLQLYNISNTKEQIKHLDSSGFWLGICVCDVLHWNARFADKLTVKSVSVWRTCCCVVKRTFSSASLQLKLQRLQRKGGNLCSQKCVCPKYVRHHENSLHLVTKFNKIISDNLKK